MKVAVLTFPLINNYGGIIQAYALMKLLKNLGHEPILVNLQSEKFYKSFVKFIVKKYVFFFSSRHKNPTLLYKSPILKRFIDREINPKTYKVYSTGELMNLFNLIDFDACVVGSDQVFAKLGYSNFENTFSLGFVSDNVIKLSYAASFGKGQFSGPGTTIEEHSKNLKRFKSISVREESGIRICKETFDVDSYHVIDPTLAISKEYYINLINDACLSSANPGLFSYVLDTEKSKEEAIMNLSKSKKLKLTSINDGNLNGEVISMEEWLNNIYSAEFVVTDSFHGCVFCIIFNKPFACIFNEGRGKDRFVSLLKQFKLEDRVLDENFEDKDINWNSVNRIMEKLQENSRKFLSENLE